MKKLAALFATTSLVLSLDVSAATFTLINGTSSEISEVYISSSGDDNWEENVIDGYVLPSGNQVNINIPNYQKFDLLIRSSDGGEEDYREFPGNVSSITLEGAGNSSYQ